MGLRERHEPLWLDDVGADLEPEEGRPVPPVLPGTVEERVVRVAREPVAAESR